jgi:hypothetical protein
MSLDRCRKVYRNQTDGPRLSFNPEALRFYQIFFVPVRGVYDEVHTRRGKGILVFKTTFTLFVVTRWKEILYTVNINFGDVTSKELLVGNILGPVNRFWKGKKIPCRSACLKLIVYDSLIHVLRYITKAHLTHRSRNMKYNKKVQKLLVSMRFYFPWAFFSTKINEK